MSSTYLYELDGVVLGLYLSITIKRSYVFCNFYILILLSIKLIELSNVTMWLLCGYEFMFEDLINTIFLVHAVYILCNSCLNYLFYEEYGNKYFL